jgi:hypothetical protein
MGTGEWQKPNRNKKPKSGKGLGNKQPVGTVEDFRPAFKKEEFPPLGTVDTRPTTKKTRLPTTPQATRTVCTENSSKLSKGTIDRSGLGTRNNPIGLQTPEIEIASTPYYSQDSSSDDDNSDSTSHESSISDRLKALLVAKANKALMRSRRSPASDSTTVTDLTKDDIGQVRESQKNSPYVKDSMKTPTTRVPDGMPKAVSLQLSKSLTRTRKPPWRQQPNGK